MPSLTLHPPQRPSNTQSNPPPRLPPLAPTSNTAAYAVPESPVAPEYSPITPKVQPVFPATYPPPSQSALNTIPYSDADASQSQPPGAIASTAQYIPEPAPQPFSGEDATDAIALRAALSSLQFQKKKAQDDIRALEKTKKQALDDPALFRRELAAGRLREQRPKVADLQAILDQTDTEDDEDQVDDEAMLGATAEMDDHDEMKPAEVPDSQPSRPTTSFASNPESIEKNNPAVSGQRAQKIDSAPFERIPGPQNVVRMPYINWDRYHITGEPLDSMHEQQRKWPGNFAYGQDRGRERTVAAPYSPWQDSLDGQGWHLGGRNDSVATPLTAMTPTSVSEHPMESRRRTNQ
ncbi:hypothetical protein LTR37_005074 [Vermiconidia calcicola]|uniref:Uncharacterized protein n=1 Tax=Vermiconidia calcicola TaxID=1690605 RepID=A0ACC3NM24_9PEZI|nr:hypothetical protein LTR37_005074 [Vermiconidia calcicola]